VYIEFLHFGGCYNRSAHSRIASPPQPGETGASLSGAERGSFFSAHCLRAIIIGQSKIDGFQHLVHFAVYLLIPESDDSVALLVEVRSARSIFFLCGGLACWLPSISMTRR
jgi:hypothetical protein